MTYRVRALGAEPGGSIVFDYIRDALPASRLLHAKTGARVGIFIVLDSDGEETLIGEYPHRKDNDDDE